MSITLYTYSVLCADRGGHLTNTEFQSARKGKSGTQGVGTPESTQRIHNNGTATTTAIIIIIRLEGKITFLPPRGFSLGFGVVPYGRCPEGCAHTLTLVFRVEDRGGYGSIRVCLDIYIHICIGTLPETANGECVYATGCLTTIVIHGVGREKNRKARLCGRAD